MLDDACTHWRQKLNGDGVWYCAVCNMDLPTPTTRLGDQPDRVTIRITWWQRFRARWRVETEAEVLARWSDRGR